MKQTIDVANRPPSWLSRALLVVLVGATFGMMGCAKIDEWSTRLSDRQEAFAAIPVGPSGADRKATIAAMGNPLTTSLTNAGGLELVILTFEDRKSRYEVALLNNKAWWKKSAPLSNPSQKEFIPHD